MKVDAICMFTHAGAVAYSNAYFGSGSGPYHLNYVRCSGSETSLLSCSRSYSIGVHNCRPGSEAGVKCGKCMIHMSNSEVNAAPQAIPA